MKPALWLPLAVFLGVSIPVVLLLQALNVNPDYRVWIALACGALATAVTQNRLQNRAREIADERADGRAEQGTDNQGPRA